MASEPQRELATFGDHVGDLSARVGSAAGAAQLGGADALVSYAMPEDRLVFRGRDVVARSRAARRVDVSGAFGCGSAIVVRDLVTRGERVVLVTSDSDAASRAAADIGFFLGNEGRRVLLHHPDDTTPYADVNPDRRGAQLRLATLAHLARGLPFDVLVTAAMGLSRKVVPPDVMNAFGELVRVNQDLDRETFARRLVAAGYSRAPLVEDPGSFALRGALVDVWSPSTERPVRIELYGDMVLSIKEFEPEAQRTTGELPEAFVSLARESPLSDASVARARDRMRALCDAANVPSAKARLLVEDVVSGRAFFGSAGFLPAFGDLSPFADYLPDDAVVVLEDPPSITRTLREEHGRVREDISRKEGDPHFPFESFFELEDVVARDIARRRVVALHRSAAVGADDEGGGGLEVFERTQEDTPTLFTFDQSELVAAIQSARKARGRGEALDPLVRRLTHLSAEGIGVVITARVQTQVERIATLLRHRGLHVDMSMNGPPPWLVTGDAPPPSAIVVARGALARGIVAPAERVALVTEEEIFGARNARKSVREGRATRGSKARAFVEDLKTLAVGDHVVHVEHGVGRYLGLVHREVGKVTVDLLAVEYAGGDKLYLPVYRLNQIQKFSGSEGAPKLDRLGGQTFAKTKARALVEVRKMADELLRLYAERRAVTRPPLPPPDDDYRAFEATFPFDETPDQARAIADVEGDFELPTPMDRLVCGDVGFGKTEIAIRAAFRAANAGRQVAVLCPTTVLAQQHYLGFVARMQNHPLEIRALSRFSTKAEQTDVVSRIKAGTVDIVIGTHRLLSKDVHFKKLGLLVVDEEQRFGVTHKERIKQLKTTVDVLTLTATPIPRTLQMAVSGIREMSIITTPPIDRRAIRTIVTRRDEAILTGAIQREIDRGGQVFFVHNRIEGLYERAARLSELLPAARIAVAHGQMNEVALEQTMLDFVEGRFDVLCATAIIESGLDIPRANTIVIDRADTFGLSQLYQLRGRVGRSRERAYCYLVVPATNEMADEARSRIEALERHTELGSGFHVASLDLELRGSGDLLGADQSGTVEAVGFELFCRMLEDAVHELRGEPVVHEIDPELSIDEEALLPDSYVEDVGVRLSLYKRLASALGEGEVEDIAREMEDRFGPPPDSARKLVRLMRLKTELRTLKVLGCEATSKNVTLHLREDTPLQTAKILVLVSAKKSSYKLTPDMRITRRIEEGEGIRGGLDAADRVLAELSRCL